MKLTKRMKNSIIQGVIANVFFSFILLGALFLFLYPRFQVIEGKKNELNEVYEKVQKITTSGISFGDFKSSVRNNVNLSKDIYTANLIKNISSEFYTTNFANTGSQAYELFLDDLETQIAIKKTSDEYIQKDQTLGLILPIYDEKNIFSNEGLSDFHFTNYIENILYSFNIASKGEIGIGDLQKEGGGEDKDTEVGNLQEDIYRIPLLFSIVGQKKDVVDFIHYFENVGSIDITQDGFRVYRDTFISKQIEGTALDKGYNIYKNQIADITSFSLEKYPDSSSLKTVGLIEAMKGEQGREKISVELELFFYVAGVPGYKMEKYIQDFLTYYEVLSIDIAKDAKKYTSQAYKFNTGDDLLAIRNLQSLDILIASMGEDVIAVRKSIAKREDIPKTYEQVVQYRLQGAKIEENYNKQLNTLTQ